jgi:peptide/nickel transport system ATP-binding protein
MPALTAVIKSPVLQVTNLALSLPALADRQYAVKDVSFSITAGETLCVVGESGSGKSMIAHAIMGLLPRAIKSVAGSINMNGTEILTLTPSAMQHMRGRQIGMIFQEPMTSLNPVMRVADQIIEVFEAHDLYNNLTRKQRMLDLLDEVGLPDPHRLAQTYPHELSGGQRQRVMIAMALALEPKLLIADEPTTALDVTTQAQILKLIDRLRRERGTAVLFITHDFGVVADIADSICVLEKGVQVEQGSADQVFNTPISPYTQRLLAAVPSLQPPEAIPHVASDPVFVVEGLGKTYSKRGFFRKGRTVQAAADISFSLAHGETLGIVGESGSGKSTVGRCCLRLIEPDHGSIILGGLSIRELSIREFRPHRKRIQMVFQDPFASLNPRRTVGQILSEGPVAHGMPQKQAMLKARELLELVGLNANAIERYPHEFSGGQRQRIGIARALALEPDILIADEAVSALDVSVQAQILKLIKDIQQRLGLAILFVTHDLRVAAQVCDRIAVMQNGRIVEHGDTATLFANPVHAYTRQLLAAVPGQKRFEHSFGAVANGP